MSHQRKILVVDSAAVNSCKCVGHNVLCEIRHIQPTVKCYRTSQGLFIETGAVTPFLLVQNECDRIRACVRARSHTHICTHTRTHARTHARTLARTHARTLARTRAHTHTPHTTHTHTHTHQIHTHTTHTKCVCGCVCVCVCVCARARACVCACMRVT